MVKKKIFKFLQNKVVDLKASPEALCNIIQCGTNRFTLTGFQLQHGHDDSIPYYATLCINDVPLCTCLNDGWGGTTEMKPITKLQEIKMKSLDLYLSKFKWTYGGQMEMGVTLDFIADTLACTEEYYIRNNIKR